ncbi:VanZ like family protein [Agreia bicolorata]|uniref:VanZ like family protein n=1 Tax=Agreia bicolorata TaxID=110935 RepID=A0A1T4WYP3_9MICO|nr:VanZ family protein [Agreia bicolorata]SKA82369.1 VanZ like family protein [Agreia bicolorata]
MTGARTRRWAWRALGVIAVTVVTITFWPTPVDKPFHSALGRLLAVLHRNGMPSWITYSAVEFSANIVMFLPLGVLIALLAWPSLWWVSGVLGLVASLTIELTQALLLSQRFASPGDVVANTAGALLGGAFICALRYGQFRGQRHISIPGPGNRLPVVRASEARSVERVRGPLE